MKRRTKQPRKTISLNYATMVQEALEPQTFSQMFDKKYSVRDRTHLWMDEIKNRKLLDRRKAMQDRNILF